MSNPPQYHILVLVNVVTQTSLGVEFCNDYDDLMFKKQMFLNDFGKDYVALTYTTDNPMLDVLLHLADSLDDYNLGASYD